MRLRNKLIAGVVTAAVGMAVPLINRVEGVEYKPYKDIAGVWTVCAGITGPDVKQGKTYTQGECDALMAKHLQTMRKQVDLAIKVDVPDTFRAAMYSFVWNVGIGSYRKSTVLRMTNQGNLKSACNHLYDWRFYTNPKTGKKEVSKGLVNRRDQEYEYCVKDLK